MHGHQGALTALWIIKILVGTKSHIVDWTLNFVGTYDPVLKSSLKMEFTVCSDFTVG